MTDVHSQSPPSIPTEPASAAVIPPALLADLTNPALCLTEVAARNDLSLSQLSNYISRAAVSNHLAAMHVLAIEHARLLASFHVAQAVRVLNEVLKRGTADHDAVEPMPSPAPASAGPASLKSAALAVRASAIRARRLETLRRAATTILQITRLNPPVFNYAGAHARLESKLPPEPAHTPIRSTSQAASVAAAAPVPAEDALPHVSKADLEPLFSTQSAINRHRSRHARNRDLESMLATAGSARPHEHWP